MHLKLYLTWYGVNAYVISVKNNHWNKVASWAQQFGSELAYLQTCIGLQYEEHYLPFEPTDKYFVAFNDSKINNHVVVFWVEFFDKVAADFRKEMTSGQFDFEWPS